MPSWSRPPEDRRGSDGTTTGGHVDGNTATGQFFIAPPIAAPVLPWRSEYGTIDDVGEVVDVGGDVYVYSAPDYALDVNTVFAVTPDGVMVVDSQLLPRHAQA